MQGDPRTRPPLPLRAFSRTEKVIAFCRVLLATAAALIVLADPRLPGALPKATVAVLLGYLVFSAVVFWLVRSERVRQERAAPLSVAADVVWITLLTLLTEQGASPFFMLHVFVISSVSVRWGFAATIRLCLFLAVLYPLTAYTASRWFTPHLFEFQRFHIFRPLYLLVLGYLIGYLGEHELRAKQKLGLMLELMTTARQQRPSGITIGLIMRRVLRFFEAEHALVALQDPETRRYFTWHLERTSGSRRFGLTITDGPTCRFAFAGGMEGILSNDPRPEAGTALCYDLATGALERHAIGNHMQLPLSNLRAMIVSPILLQQGLHGHAIVGSSGSRRFSRDDLEFLLLLVAQGAVALEAGRLQDKAEAMAVLEERARIARDLHDGFIQSLAAIDLRVETCKRLVETAPTQVPSALDELHIAVERGYGDVRRYLKVLRDTTRPIEGLGTAIDRIVAEFALRHRMRVDVHRPPTDPDLPVTTVHELTQIILEALNNAVRHGNATTALVKLGSAPSHVFLIVRDNGRGFTGQQNGDDFLPLDRMPWSIRERAQLLGADLRIRSRPGEGSEVSLVVPRRRSAAMASA